MKRLGMLFVLSLTMVLPMKADSWRPITRAEFHSAAGKHVLKIRPHSHSAKRPGRCLATLYKVDGPKRTELWSRNLINNHAPVRIFVADSGQYVVTMDEWHSVGELPVVVYGPSGRLIRVHDLESLGVTEETRDFLKIRRTVSSDWWNEDSISFFDPEEKFFLIRLHWGKWIILELERGMVLTRETRLYGPHQQGLNEAQLKELEKMKRPILAKEAVCMVSSRDASTRKTGITICGQERFREAIPPLRARLLDPEYFTTNSPQPWTKIYYIRQAAKEALELMGETVEDVVLEEPRR